MYRFGHCSDDLQDVYIDNCDNEVSLSVNSSPLTEMLDGDPIGGDSSSLTGTVNMNPVLTWPVDMDLSRTETMNTAPNVGHGEIISVPPHYPWSLIMSDKKQSDGKHIWGPLGAGDTEASSVAWSASGALAGLKRKSKASDSGCCVAVKGSSGEHEDTARFPTHEDSGKNSIAFGTCIAPAVKPPDANTRPGHIASGCANNSTADSSVGQEGATVQRGTCHHDDHVEECGNILQRCIEAKPQGCFEPTRQFERLLQSPAQKQLSMYPLSHPEGFQESLTQPKRPMTCPTQQQEPTAELQGSLEHTPQALRSSESHRQAQGLFQSLLHRSGPTPAQQQRSLEPTAQPQDRSGDAPENRLRASDIVASEPHTCTMKLAEMSLDSDLNSSLSSLDSGSSWLRMQKLTLSETSVPEDPAYRSRRAAGDSQGKSIKKRACVPTVEAQTMPRAQPLLLSTLTSGLSHDLTMDNFSDSAAHKEATGWPELTLSRQSSHQSWQHEMQLCGQGSHLSPSCRPQTSSAFSDMKPTVPDKGVPFRLSSTTQMEIPPSLYLASPAFQASSAPHQASSALHQAGSALHQASSAPHQAGSVLHPHQAGSAPHQAGNALQQAGSAPQQAGSAPYQASSAPHQAGSALHPHQASSAPHQAGSAPHQAGSALQQAGSAPQQAGSAPYQASSAPHQAGSAPYQAGNALHQTSNAPYQSSSACPQSSSACHQGSSAFDQSRSAPHQTSLAAHQSTPVLPQPSSAPQHSSCASQPFSWSPQQSRKWTSPNGDLGASAQEPSHNRTGPHEQSDQWTNPQESSQNGSNGTGGARKRPDFMLQKSADSTMSSGTYPPQNSSLLADIQWPPLPVQEHTWREMNTDRELFVSTKTMIEAWDTLQDQSIVLLTGPPHSGKTTLARALLRRAEANGWSCCSVTNFSEWRKWVVDGQSKIILLDEVFGRRGLKEGEVDLWRESLEGMWKWCRKGTLQLIFTFCPHVLQAFRQALPNTVIFSQGYEVIVGPLDNAEKKEMVFNILNHKVTPSAVTTLVAEARCHIWDREEEFNGQTPEETRDWLKLFEMLVKWILEIDESGAMFPKCCRWLSDDLNMYVPLPDSSREESHLLRYLESAVKIFSRPSPLYKEIVSHLFLEQNVPRENMQAALCVLLASLNVRDVSIGAQIKNTCQNLGFSFSFSPVGLQEMLMKWRCTLVEKDCSKFVNRHAYEGTALALAQNIPSSVVKAVDWPFLVKRCNVPMENTKKSPLDHRIKSFQLEIKRVALNRTSLSPEYTVLVERIAGGLKDPDNMLSAVQHSALQSCDFVKDLMSFYIDQEGEDAARMVFSETHDSTYKMSLLYWSVFNSHEFLFQWIFKTVIGKLHGKFDKRDLVMAAYACCVLKDKAEFLKLLLRYWNTAARENVCMLLQGEHLKPPSSCLRLPLPKAEMCLVPSWNEQLKYISFVLKSSADTHRAGSERITHTVLNYDTISGARYFATEQRTVASPPPAVSSPARNRSMVQAPKHTSKGIDLFQRPLLEAIRFKNQEVEKLLSEQPSETKHVAGARR